MPFGMIEEWPHFLKIEAAERRALFFGQQDNFRSSGDSSTRARTDGGRSSQRNSGRRGREQRRETACTLNSAIDSLAQANRTAERFDRAIRFFAQKRTYMVDFVIDGF